MKTLTYSFDENSQPLTNKVNELFMNENIQTVGNTLLTLTVWFVCMASEYDVIRAREMLKEITDYMNGCIELQITAELECRTKQ